MSTPERIEFFFDPGCPWTWQTSRWVRSVAGDLRWRAFRLELLSDEPLPPQWVESAAMSATALRLVEALAAQGRHADIDRFYTALGERAHDRLEPASPELARSTAVACGFGAADLQTLDDAALDEAVRASFAEAQSLVGPGLGSPVLAVTFADGRRRGLFGPVVTGPLDPTDAAQLWDACLTLLRVDRFAELKRGRDLLLPLDASLTPHV